jgi:hypothetical protein
MSATATPTLVAWKQKLRAALTEDPTPEAACEWLGVPKLSDFPTPGEARLWLAAEWKEWSAARGYDSGTKTTHSTTFVHKAHDAIRISALRSGGDPRAAMNCAADTRRNTYTALQSIGAALRERLDTLPDDETAARAAVKQWSVRDCRPGLLGKDIVTVPGASVYKLISDIARDYKVSMRSVVTGAYGCDINSEIIDAVISRAKTGVPIPEESRFLLLEYRKTLAAQDLIEREARKAAREASRSFTTKVKAPNEVVTEMVEALQKARRQGLDAVIGALNSAIDRARLAREEVDRYALTIPDLTDPAAAEQIESLTSELTQSNCDRDAARSECELLKEELKAVRSSGGKEHRHAFAKLILELVTTTDFSNLATNLRALKDAAADEIKESDEAKS